MNKCNYANGDGCLSAIFIFIIFFQGCNHSRDLREIEDRLISIQTKSDFVRPYKTSDYKYIQKYTDVLQFVPRICYTGIE